MRLDIDRWMESPVPRRRFLAGAGKGALGLSLASLLAACGDDEPGGAATSSAETGALPPIAGSLKVAQWPLYIDRARGGHRPTLESFADETGIDVDYREIISDNQDWFAKLYPQLSRGEAIGWDLMCIADWLVHQMASTDYVVPLHWDALPTAQANMLDAFRDPAYDPGNARSVPWQGGVTGIAYYPDLVGGQITGMADLWNPKLEDRVGMLTEMVDTMTLTLLMLGIDPHPATVDDAARAQEKLLEQRDAGIVRDYYGNEYTDELATGSLWASMAWSGDVFALALDNPNLRFIIPEEGAMRWSDNMVIPAPAEHPTDAHVWMDFVYRPRIAADITEWVWYESPVSQVPDIIRADAEKAGGAEGEFLLQIAESPLVFPDEETLAVTYPYKQLEEEEEAAWNELYQEVYQR